MAFLFLLVMTSNYSIGNIHNKIVENLSFVCYNNFDYSKLRWIYDIITDYSLL